MKFFKKNLKTTNSDAVCINLSMVGIKNRPYFKIKNKDGVNIDLFEYSTKKPIPTNWIDFTDQNQKDKLKKEIYEKTNKHIEKYKKNPKEIIFMIDGHGSPNNKIVHGHKSDKKLEVDTLLPILNEISADYKNQYTNLTTGVLFIVCSPAASSTKMNYDYIDENTTYAITPISKDDLLYKEGVSSMVGACIKKTQKEKNTLDYFIAGNHVVYNKPSNPKKIGVFSEMLPPEINPIREEKKSYLEKLQNIFKKNKNTKEEKEKIKFNPGVIYKIDLNPSPKNLSGF